MNVMAFLGLRFDPNLVDIVSDFLVSNISNFYNPQVRIPEHSNYAFEVILESWSKIFTIRDAQDEADALVKFCTRIKDDIVVNLNTKIIIYGGNYNSELDVTKFVELLYEKVLSTISSDYLFEKQVGSKWTKMVCKRLQQSEEK